MRVKLNFTYSIVLHFVDDEYYYFRDEFQESEVGQSGTYLTILSASLKIQIAILIKFKLKYE